MIAQHKILFLDDLEDWRKLLAGLLRDRGYAVTAVPDPEAARQALRRERFDLAILDMRLDDGDDANVEGLELAGSLKAIYPSLPVFILTGYATLETVARGMRPDERTGERLIARFVEKDDTHNLPAYIDELLAGNAQT